MGHDRRGRRRRPVSPHGIDWIAIGRDQLPARPAAGIGNPARTLFGMQPGVEAELLAFLQLRFEPGGGRLVGDVTELEQLSVDLFARLNRIAPVDKQRRLVGQHDGKTRRPGESGQPEQALSRRRHVLALVLVRPRHHETVQSTTLEFGAQCGNPFRVGRVAGYPERLVHDLITIPLRRCATVSS